MQPNPPIVSVACFADQACRASVSMRRASVVKHLHLPHGGLSWRSLCSRDAKPAGIKSEALAGGPAAGMSILAMRPEPCSLVFSGTRYSASLRTISRHSAWRVWLACWVSRMHCSSRRSRLGMSPTVSKIKSVCRRLRSSPHRRLSTGST